jgi:DNA/RNA endonuclease YhcR with UshA esterase domain
MLALIFSALAVVVQAPNPAQKPAQGPPVITPDQAAKYVGKEVIVQGKITQIALTVNLTTHINFGGLYPNHVFTVTIFKAKQTQFPGVRDYEGKNVEVQGVVHLYRGKPEIVLEERSQIRLTPE